MRVGKREIKFSLETSDAGEAKIRQAAEQARWRSYFKQLEAEIDQEVIANAPVIVDAFLEDMAGLSAITAKLCNGLSLRQLVR